MICASLPSRSPPYGLHVRVDMKRAPPSAHASACPPSRKRYGILVGEVARLGGDEDVPLEQPRPAKQPDPRRLAAQLGHQRVAGHARPDAGVEDGAARHAVEARLRVRARLRERAGGDQAELEEKEPEVSRARLIAPQYRVRAERAGTMSTLV